MSGEKCPNAPPIKITTSRPFSSGLANAWLSSGEVIILPFSSSRTIKSFGFRRATRSSSLSSSTNCHSIAHGFRSRFSYSSQASFSQLACFFPPAIILIIYFIIPRQRLARPPIADRVFLDSMRRCPSSRPGLPRQYAEVSVILLQCKNQFYFVD